MSTIAEIRARSEPVAWPEAEGIDFPPFDEGRPCIAGTRFLVAILKNYQDSGLSRPDLVQRVKDDWAFLPKASIGPALDYYERHAALFARDERWRFAAVEEVRADVRALLAEVDRRDAEVARLRAALAEVGQAAHGAHGGRGSFRWCGERCCDLARRGEQGGQP